MALENSNTHTILVVEDEEINFILIDKFLANLPLKIIHAKNGQEAIEKYKQNQDIELVLMDIKMPVLNGFEATVELKKINPSLIIVAQTAYAMKEDRKKALDIGCDDYISKPLKHILLVDMIKKYLKI